MTQIFMSIISVLAVNYIVPFILYAISSAIGWVKNPEGSPILFLLSVFVSKIGTAIAFVLLFYFARSAFLDNWLLYAGLWWIMFVLGEIGQAIAPNYSWKEATIGIISETIYLPISAYIVFMLLV